MNRFSVVIADDNEWVRELVKNALEPYFAIDGSVGDGEALIDAVVADEPDVVVAEIALARLDGLDAMHSLRARGYSAPFVMISTDPDAGAECLRAGAAAFVCKVNIGRELAPAVLFACETATCAELYRVSSYSCNRREPWHSKDMARSH